MTDLTTTSRSSHGLRCLVFDHLPGIYAFGLQEPYSVKSGHDALDLWADKARFAMRTVPFARETHP